MIFSQLDEQMRGMDRSLLEKIAADIEMVDKNEGNVILSWESLSFQPRLKSSCALSPLPIDSLNGGAWLNWFRKGEHWRMGQP